MLRLLENTIRILTVLCQSWVLFLQETGQYRPLFRNDRTLNPLIRSPRHSLILVKPRSIYNSSVVTKACYMPFKKDI